MRLNRTVSHLLIPAEGPAFLGTFQLLFVLIKNNCGFDDLLIELKNYCSFIKRRFFNFDKHRNTHNIAKFHKFSGQYITMITVI